MKKILLLPILLIFFVVPNVIAGKSTYIVTNHRLNYVKLNEVKGKTAKLRLMTHPRDIDEAKMADVLRSIKISKRQIIGKKVNDQSVFNESAVNFLAPALTRALRKASSIEEIVFSYIVKDPLFVIRNDRLTMGKLWMHNDELHIEFGKLYAKLIGDTDKRGDYSKIVSKAKGLRIDFDLEPGQTLNPDNTDELIVDLNNLISSPAQQIAEKEVVKEDDGALSDGINAPKMDVESRLKTLEDLKKKKLITKDEYKTKRSEILHGL